MRKVNNPDQRKELTTEIVNYSNAIQPMPGAKEALTQLKTKGDSNGNYYWHDCIHWNGKFAALKSRSVAEFIDISGLFNWPWSPPNQIHQFYSYAIQQSQTKTGRNRLCGSSWDRNLKEPKKLVWQLSPLITTKMQKQIIFVTPYLIFPAFQSFKINSRKYCNK